VPGQVYRVPGRPGVAPQTVYVQPGRPQA
jgi:hypothetical protein